MIDHVWTVLCSRSVIDQDSNNITLFEVLEQLTITGPPLVTGEVGVVPIACELVTLWSRTRDNQASRGYGRAVLLSPSETVIREQEYDIDLTVHARTRHRVRLHGLPIQEAGRYRFRVDVRDEGEREWRTVASVPLEVVLAPAETQA